MALLLAQTALLRAVDLRNVLTGYSLTSWGPADGLPSSEVLAIVQDHDGYLWLGTDAGLVRFDGVRFASWPVLPPNRSVRALCVGRDGDLWVGLGEDGGIVRVGLRGPEGRFGETSPDPSRSYAEPEGLDRGSITALVEDSKGILWAGTLNGLYRYADDRWARVSDSGLPSGAIYSIDVDVRRRLLVSTAEGVFQAQLPEMAFTPVDTRPTDAIRGISVDTAGEVWLTDGTAGFRGLHVGGTAVASAEAGRGARLLHDRAGNLWVGTWGQGLWRVQHEPASGRLVVERSTALTGLLGNGVNSLLEDREGNIWAGTLDGLNRLTPNKATPLTTLGLVSGVEATRHGIWVATSEAVILFAGAGPADTLVAAPLVRFRGAVTTMHADERGEVWVSTGDRLWRLAGDEVQQVPLLGTAPQRIDLVTSDRRGGLWFYDVGRGLMRWSAERVTPFTLPPELQQSRLTWMDTQRDGRLWIATADGHIAVVSPDGRVQPYGERDGLQGDAYRALHEDRHGVIWLGGSRGLTRLSAGRFETLRRANEHPLQALTAIVEDTNGHLWLGTRSGILRILPDDFDRALAATSQRIPYRLYGKSDGLAGNPRWYGNRGAVRAADGRLWFVTSRGATVIDPTVAVVDHEPTPVHIDGSLVDEHWIGGAAGAVLPAGTRKLDILFSALTLTAPSATHFRYRLDGFDAGWVEVGTRRQASYTNLAPGHYQFRVMASSADGTWPEPSAVWTFAIEPMFYQTRWFLAACLALFAGTLMGAWRLRVRQVRAQFSMLLAERARLGREIHDTLLQGLFGVALRCDAIANEVETAAPRVRDHFASLRRDVEGYIREARQSIWNLRSPKIERIGLAAALHDAGEQAAATAGVAFAFEARGRQPRTCAAETEEQLLRIGQEAVTNAVRHAHASEIHMALEYDAHEIVLRVHDNGVGFDVDRVDALKHYGLTSMHERAVAAGGVLRLASTIGRGTDVEVRAPYEAVTVGC